MTSVKKVVLDTNILVSALWSADGNPNRITHMIADEEIVPCYCDEILAEYQTVLTRPAFRFTDEQINSLINNLIKYGEHCDAQKSDIAMPDESDRVFYDVAKTCDAILITGNIKHYPVEPNIKTPADFLNDVTNR